MKLIGIISDTHIPKTVSELPENIYREFRNVDMILHAGDFVELAVLEKLQAVAPTRAVSGNMDMDEVKAALPTKDVIKLGKFSIGLIHGYGPPGRIVDTVSQEFKKNVDVIVFGHSHSPFLKEIKGTLFFNPGSPTDKIFAPYNSIGLLEVGEEIKGRIIRI